MRVRGINGIITEFNIGDIIYETDDVLNDNKNNITKFRIDDFNCQRNSKAFLSHDYDEQYQYAIEFNGNSKRELNLASLNCWKNYGNAVVYTKIKDWFCALNQRDYLSACYDLIKELHEYDSNNKVMDLSYFKNMINKMDTQKIEIQADNKKQTEDFCFDYYEL